MQSYVSVFISNKKSIVIVTPGLKGNNILTDSGNFKSAFLNSVKSVVV